MRIVDLSLPLHPDLPVYPGDEPVEFRQLEFISRGGYDIHRICLGTHAGTHIDAPAHSIRNGMAVDHPDILEACVGKAFLCDVQGKKREAIVPEQIPELAEILASERRIVFRTGWSARYGEPGYYTDHPVISPELAGMIAGSNIRLLGIDTPSVESGETAAVHSILLGAGVAIAENLANLDQIPRGGFFLSAAPLGLTGLDGSPVRAYALLDW